MLGKHAVVLADGDSLEAYVADEMVRFRMLLNGEEEAEAALPAEEFLIPENTQEIKILALFSNEDDPHIVGKLKLRVSYKKEPSSEDFVGKETTINLYLPKNGHQHGGQSRYRHLASRHAQSFGRG